MKVASKIKNRILIQKNLEKFEVNFFFMKAKFRISTPPPIRIRQQLFYHQDSQRNFQIRI